MLGVAQRMPDNVAEGQAQLCGYASTLPTWMPAQRQAEVLGTLAHAQLTVLSHNLLCSFAGIGAGSASSLPSLVLRSMLKQRRILMRMH